MVQMDIPAAFAFSQIFAWLGRRRLRQEPVALIGRYTQASVLYAVGVIGPCALYLYGGWPEWETMYWFAAVHMDTANFGDALFALVGPLFLISLAVSAALGFLLAHRWIQAGKLRRVVAGIWIGLALSVGVVLVTPTAPMFVGHFDNYQDYLRDAAASGRAWDYGMVALGRWMWGVPTSAKAELLARYNLITILNPKFLIPLLLDSLVYFGSAVVFARWFSRQQPAPLMEAAPDRVLTGRR